MSERRILLDLVAFGRELRARGAEVGPGRIADAARALETIGLGDRNDVYFALRQTLVSGRDELELFDRALAAWAGDEATRPAPPRVASVRYANRAHDLDGDDGDTTGDRTPRLGASTVELLRTRDFSSLSEAEVGELRRLLEEFGHVRPRRMSRRLRPHARGERLDLRRLARRSIHRG